MTEHERVLYRGMVCTVVAEHANIAGIRGRKYDLRDPYGFLIESVPKRQVQPLREDDERRTFRT